MPELPEVETIRRDLDKEATGKKIKAVEVTGARSVRRHKDKKEFIARLEGTKITGVGRRGKNLLVSLDSKDVLVIHLGMSGQLLHVKSAKTEAPKHTHIVITFTQGGLLRFVDPRTFGEMFVVTPDQLDDNSIEELAHIGFDPVENAVSWVEFAQNLVRRKAKLKTVMLDQTLVAGIGNMYADEILWEAGLLPDRASEKLSSQEIRRLYRAMTEVLQEAVKHRGSSLADEQYVDLYGKMGTFQKEHKVYAREGQACPRCRTAIIRKKLGDRSTFYCERCQV